MQTRCVIKEAGGQRLLALNPTAASLDRVAHQRMRHQAELLEALPPTGVPRLVRLRSKARASWLLFEFVDGWPLHKIHDVMDRSRTAGCCCGPFNCSIPCPRCMRSRHPGCTVRSVRGHRGRRRPRLD